MSSFNNLETISDIFGSSSENLLVGQGEEQMTPESGAMSDETADVGLKPSDIVKDSDGAESESETEDMFKSVAMIKEVIDRIFQENLQLKAEVKKVKKEKDDMTRIVERYEKTLERFEREKNSLEDRIYSKFLPVLNAKKEEILRLQKLLSRGTEAEVDYGEDTDVDEEDGEAEKKRQKQ